MSATPYGHMGLVRLSPNTGKELTRLNVIQGQILHGKVYKMENFSEGQAQADGAKGGSGGGGGVARIAMGALLIEAIVSQPLPEGSSVKLEVIKLADESFTLKLLELNGEKIGRSSPATISRSQDQAEWSNYVRDQMLRGEIPVSHERPLGEQIARDANTANLVKLPEFASLPKPVANAIRAAVSDSLINPSNFSLNNSEIKSAILNTLNSTENIVNNTQSAQTPVSTGLQELIESFNSIVKLLRPAVNALPSDNVSVNQPTRSIAPLIRDIAAALRTYIPQTPASESGSAPQTQQTVSSEGGKGQTYQAPISGTAQQSAVLSQQIQLSTIQGIAKPPLIDPPTDIQGARTIGQAGESQNNQQIAQSLRITLERSNSEINPVADRSNDSQNILFGLRMLAKLSESMAQVRPLAVEESASFTNAASRLTSTSHAFEGAMISPIFTHVMDSPDLIPRLLLSLLFPGGAAELGIMTPSFNQDGSSDQAPDNEGKSRGGEPVVGVIRISTEGLGDVGVRVEYTDSGDESPGRVYGRFTAAEISSDALRNGLPSLESALDARGISSGGFLVVEIKSTSDSETNTNEDLPPKTKNGLDIKI